MDARSTITIVNVTTGVAQKSVKIGAPVPHPLRHSMGFVGQQHHQCLKQDGLKIFGHGFFSLAAEEVLSR